MPMLLLEHNSSPDTIHVVMPFTRSSQVLGCFGQTAIQQFRSAHTLVKGGIKQ